MPDSASFDAFYRDTYDGTLRYLYGMTGDAAEAEDVTQEAYGRAWRRWDTVGSMADPARWVRTVGWRVAADRFRHLRVVARRRLAWTASTPVREPGPDSVALVDALKRIPADQRQAVVLHYALDLSVQQVAAETGVSVSATKARLARGRQALGALLRRSEETTDA